MPELTPGMAGQGSEGAPADGGDKGFDFERGYTQLRPEFTRATQELAATQERLSEYDALVQALRDPDPEVQAAAADALGLELVTETGPQAPSDEDEWIDPLEEEVAELRAWRDEVQEQRELEAAEQEDEEIAEVRDNYVGEAITALEEQIQAAGQPGFEFTEHEEAVLGNLAIAMEDAQGIPDIDGAYQALYGDEGFLETNRSRWIGTKTGAAQPPSGRTVSSKPTLDSAEKRVNYVDNRWRELSDQQ